MFTKQKKNKKNIPKVLKLYSLQIEYANAENTASWQLGGTEEHTYFLQYTMPSSDQNAIFPPIHRFSIRTEHSPRTINSAHLHRTKFTYSFERGTAMHIFFFLRITSPKFKDFMVY